MAAVSSNFDLKWPEQTTTSRSAEISIDLVATAAALLRPGSNVPPANPEWRACQPAGMEGPNPPERCGEALRRDLHRSIQRAAGGTQSRSTHDYPTSDGG